jgi:hypothetical protein
MRLLAGSNGSGIRTLVAEGLIFPGHRNLCRFPPNLISKILFVFGRRNGVG